MLLEIHMLKNYPSTNLNRDDSGSPKSCIFGGIERGRISSQCLKRSWRTSEYFAQSVNCQLGIRTRKLPELVCEELSKMGVSDEYIAIAKTKVSAFGNKEGKAEKGGITSQIIIYSPQDITAVAKKVYDGIQIAGSLKAFDSMNVTEWQKQMKDVKTRPITLDIALFGRMVTSDAFEDVEASMQVAHAISTNRVTMENDYFTAVDDLVSGSFENDAGAAMIGDIDYNSNCYYIYAAIDVDQLQRNLKYTPEVQKMIYNAIPALIQTMAFSSPSGKQNTFAGHVLPEIVMVECKDKKVAVNYVNAFVSPARQHGDINLVRDSVDKLVNEVDLCDQNYALVVRERMWFDARHQCAPKKATNCADFGELICEIERQLAK